MDDFHFIDIGGVLLDDAEILREHAEEIAGRPRPRPRRPTVGEVLSAGAWMERVFPPSERLLGELVTTKSRTLLAGYTGLGKTMIGMAMAVGMATGTGFLHWRSSRPVRVLYLDGEMAGELLQARIKDAVRRAGGEPPACLWAYSVDQADATAQACGVGELGPLNSEEGRLFLLDLIEGLGGIDVVICDNVMSLTVGDQKDEIVWSETLPLVQQLTKLGVAQVWIDHTGHDASRLYGSNTKAWRMDTVGIMTRLSDQQSPNETGFGLSFDHPGKARRRTPDNWQQFAPQTIRLRDDAWTTEASGSGAAGKIPPSRRPFYEALQVAIGRGILPGETTMDAWEAMCVQRGLIDPPGKCRENDRRKPLRRAQSDLISAKLISVEDDRIMDLGHRY